MILPSLEIIGSDLLNFFIEIDGVNPNTYRWSKDGGKTFVEERLVIDGAAHSLTDGLNARFSTSTGHGLGDYWTVLAAHPM